MQPVQEQKLELVQAWLRPPLCRSCWCRTRSHLLALPHLRRVLELRSCLRYRKRNRLSMLQAVPALVRLRQQLGQVQGQVQVQAQVQVQQGLPGQKLMLSPQVVVWEKSSSRASGRWAWAQMECSVRANLRRSS